VGSFTNLLSFFICSLCFRVSMGYLGSGLAQAEPQLPKQSLALPYTELLTELLFDERRQGLPIPQMCPQSQLRRRAAQDLSNLTELLFGKPPWAPRPWVLPEASKAIPLEPMYPVLHRTWCVTQHPAHLGTGHTMSYEQHRMQTVVVASIG